LANGDIMGRLKDALKRLDDGFAKDHGLSRETVRKPGLYYVALRDRWTVAAWVQVSWLGWSGRQRAYCWKAINDLRSYPDSHFDIIGQLVRKEGSP